MSDHQINNDVEQQTQDMNIDNIDDNEDLDAFLVLLESRLRADFTSPDLSRIISSQGTSSSSAANRSGGGTALSTLPSGNPSSPTKFIRLIYKVFTKAGKPIKLRSILSMLGLDDDDTIERDAKNSSNNGMSSFATTSNFNNSTDELQDRKTDEVVYKLLTKAEEDDEKWVRVIAGIIKRIMFSKPSDATSNTPKEKSESNEKKESESDKQLRKIVTNILSSINKTSIQAEQRYNEAKLKLYKQIDEESTDEIEVQQKQSAASNTLSTYLIGSDLYPTYAPLRYTLLPPSTIKSIIPNVNTNVHFTSNMNANVLKIDAEVDAKRAEEEGKEMLSVQQKQQVSAVTATNGSGVGGRGLGGRTTNQTGGGAVLAGRMRGRFSNTAGRGSTTTSGSSLFRPSTTGRGSAAGRMGTVGGRAGRISGRGGRLGGRTGGRVGSLARLTGGRGTTTGRGSMSAPLQRRVPGAARAILNSTSGRGRGGTISGKSSSGGGGEKTKMKMIDASEVEGLTRQANEKEKTSNMTSVQARKLERKRKLMETAKASGLRGREKKITKTEAVEAATTGNDQATKSSTISGGGTDTSQNKSTNVTATMAASQQVQPQQQPPSAAYVSLLEKSNKLTPEDRQTILLFFQNRNPVQPGLRPPLLSLPPGADESTGIFKVKLNEEKTFDESTNENVKETLYLELNYKTLGFKKTRKIKRK